MPLPNVNYATVLLTLEETYLFKIPYVLDQMKSFHLKENGCCLQFSDCTMTTAVPDFQIK